MSDYDCIVGGYGFVGSHLVERLTGEGFRVLVIEKRDVSPPCDLLRTDLRYLDERVEADYVFHLAGVVNYAYSEMNPVECFEANVLSTLGMLRRVKARKKFILASSAAVYSKAEGAIAETHAIGPSSVYGVSKVMAEQLVIQQSRKNPFDWAIVRPFNIYGPRQTQAFLIPQLLTQAKSGLMHLRNNDTRRDFVHVKDALDFFDILMRTEGQITINLGSGKSCSTREVAETVAAFYPDAGIESEERYDSFSPLALHADIGLANAIGWSPKVSLYEGVKDMIEHENR